jgi:two-component system CheB/CheR fusion protein
MTDLKNSPHGFPVVGIGASAGGIPALQKFFSNTSPDGGMAYVVILHMPPEHDSKLAEILQLSTSMPVRKVTETVLVEPDHVYVIPPEHNLAMVDGVIDLTQRDVSSLRQVPVDLFFRTLAEAYGRDAYAVVLSGTGADGTLGMERIKEMGGMAFAQDPQDAEFDGMPLSAIATGLIDVVLPAADLSAKITSIHAFDLKSRGRGQPKIDPFSGETTDAASLREILSLVRLRTGHDFSSYKRPTLLRRIDRRLQVHELSDMESYFRLLKVNPDEVTSLLRDLLITVTNFFRDQDSFIYLQQTIIPRLFEGKGLHDWVRVWSCGVGTGEEAYTLGMLLLEHQATLADPPKVQIFASDINEDAIRIGRDGIYPPTIAADVDPEYLKRFFNVFEGSYRVTKELRDVVLFAPHNVLRDPPFSRIDLISCRNLLIYLNRDTQKKVMEVFSFALNKSGYLFLGSSEAAESDEDLFLPLEKKHRVYQNVQEAKRSIIPIAPALGKWELKLSDARLGSGGAEALIETLHLRLASRFAPPSVMVSETLDIMHMTEGMEKFLQIPAGSPTRSLLKSVHRSLKFDLRAVLSTAAQNNEEQDVNSVKLVENEADLPVNILVRPVEIGGSRHYLVVFTQRPLLPPGTSSARPEGNGNGDGALESVVERLEDELREARERQRQTLEHGGVATEELKASNEELQAINEELRSTTEELETSREELQSVNEEMAAVNLELKDKIDEISTSHSDLQNLMHSTDIGTIFLARDLTIKRYTRRIEQLFNIIGSDIGRPFEHLTHKFDYPHLADDAREVLSSLQTVEREVRIASSKTTYLARLLPYRTLEDSIEGVVMSFVNITELKQTADSLLEREQQLRMAQEAARAGVWSLDLEAGTAWWSEEYLKLHGGKLGPIEPTMENWLRHFHPHEETKVSKEIDNAIRNKSQYIHEFKLELASGEHWVMDVGRAIYNAEGKPVQMAGISMDVTERILLRQEQVSLLHKKEAYEEDLREAGRKKDEFLAMVAHELRTPLAPVRTGIEILKNTELGSDRASGVIATLERQVVQMVHLIDDLLDVSRITSGKLDLKNVVVNLDQVIAQAVETVQPLFDQLGHDVRVEADQGIQVTGDPTRLVQVVSNLLSNAAKYTAPGGRIEISLKVSNGDAVLSVTDNGDGIELEMQERIFDMFGQVQRLERLPQGLGIGLALVRSLVEKHSGSISVHSDGSGYGSVFTVRLPLLDLNSVLAPPADVEDIHPALPSPDEETRRVLVVDDSVSTADMISLFFKLDGYTTFTAYDGPSAFAIFEVESPEFVFSDIGMPGMSGHDLARKIRDSGKGDDTVLIALTGWGQQEDIAKSIAAGFDHHLTKPVDPKMLRSFLAMHPAP